MIRANPDASPINPEDRMGISIHQLIQATIQTTKPTIMILTPEGLGAAFLRLLSPIIVAIAPSNSPKYVQLKILRCKE